MTDLAAEGHRTETREIETGLHGVGVEPSVGIGQRGLVVQTADGNVLFEVPGFIDEAAVGAVRELGGLTAVTASHPHFYGAAVEWSHAFDVPILIAEPDRRWLTRPDPAVELWSGRLEVLAGVTLVQCGGHFPGSAVLHWADGADGRGVLLTGDTLLVTPGRDRVTFVRSAPNRLPLPQALVELVLAAIADLRYDRIYGGWWDAVIERDAREVVARSAARYLEWLTGAALSDAESD